MWRSKTSLCTLSDKVLSNVIRHIQIETSHLTVLQLYEYICNAEHVYFESYVSSFSDFYYDEDISGKVVKDLLRYQFQDDEDVIRHFITTLFHVLNRSNGKKNCLNLIGEPTSFKSTFVQMVASAMINTGWCNKNNKYVSFGLQECARKRLIVMDDPNYDPGCFEQLKTIFSGNPTNIPIKFEGDYTLAKTPVIVCSNCDYFKGQVWDERIEKYYWKSWNTRIVKELNPYTLYNLFIEYELLQ